MDGAKTDGVESLLKDCKKIFSPLDTLSKAHGKLFWFTRPAIIPDAAAAWMTPATGPTGWHTAPGVFSADAVDRGSALLINTLPPLSGRVADLGAGWGYLSAEALQRMPAIDRIDLIEAEWAALDAARANVTDPRAHFFWADALNFEGGDYDAILMNPPFHPSRKADPGLGQAFVRAAARRLKRDASLTLVANQHLPYEAVLSDCFAELSTRATRDGFKILHARKPRPAPSLQ